MGAEKDVEKVFLAAAAAAFIVFSAWSIAGHPFAGWDESVYLNNAKWLAGAGAYHELMRPPLLAVVLAPFAGLDLAVVRALMAAIFAASAAALFLLAREWFEKETAAVAVGVYLLVPAAWRNSALVLTHGLEILFVLLSLWCLSRAKTDKRLAFVSPAFFSLAFLARYSAAAFAVPFAAAVAAVLWEKKPGQNKGLRKSLLAGAALGLFLVGAWAAACFAQTGDPLYSFKEAFAQPVEYSQETPWQQALGEAGFSIPWWLPLLAVIGFAAALRDGRRGGADKRVLAVGFFALAAFAAFAFYPHKEPRYLLEALPFLAVLAALAARRWKIVFALLVLALAYANWLSASAAAADWAAEAGAGKALFEASKALAAVVPPGARVVSDFWPVASLYAGVDGQWYDYGWATPERVEKRMGEEGIGWIALQRNDAVKKGPCFEEVPAPPGFSFFRFVC